jgi:hypothetical protein
MADTIRKLKRSEYASFLNTGTTELPVWAIIGKGVTEGTISYNPEVSNEKFINEDNAHPSVDGYAPTLPIEQTAYKGDPVFDFIDGIRKARKLGAECETELLNVQYYNEVTGDPTKWEAEKQKVAIQIDEFAGDAMKIKYTINYVGDPVIGKVSLTAGAPVFTAN